MALHIIFALTVVQSRRSGVMEPCTQLLNLVSRRWSGIPSMGWTVVGLAFVAGASGAAFNHFYTGELDKETRQKYTAATTFV